MIYFNIYFAYIVNKCTIVFDDSIFEYDIDDSIFEYDIYVLVNLCHKCDIYESYRSDF